VYHIVTELPAIFILYDSSNWSFAFLMLIFGVSVWNGGGYYIEVFGRKFERELEALRKELAASQSSQYSTNGSGTPSSSHPGSPLPASKIPLAEVEGDTTSPTTPAVISVTEDATASTSGASQSGESPIEGVFLESPVVEVEGLQLGDAVMDGTLDTKSKSE